MSCYYISIQGGKKLSRVISCKEEYKQLRGSSVQLTNLRQVRKGNEAAKRRLVQFNYSCLPNEDGTLKGASRLSGSVGMDVDHIPASELQVLIENILSKKDELGLLMLERSARGEGLHVVFTRHPELSQEENLKWASDLLGVEYDKGAKDITRVFFATSNEADDLLYLDEKLFECEEVVAGATGRSDADGVCDTDGGDDRLKSTVTASPETASEELTYMNIPYSEIIAKWWEMYNGGKEPVKSNRDVLTFELAVNLRHICGFDRDILDQIIPCYDSFPEVQKMKCIDSALAERRTQMPKRMKDVLTALSQKSLITQNNQEALAAFDEMMKADELYHYDRLPQMPIGVSDSIEAAGHSLAMPTLITIAPAIGALATGVKLDVHGKAKGLNLCSFIVGEFASGKGQMDDIVAAWMNELQTETDIYTKQEEEWAAKTSRMKSGKAPEQPKLPVRMLTLNNTVANIAERLANTEGKHSFSYTPEADNVALKWKQSVSDFSVMLRQAYDEARYDREAKSADAVRVHIQKLLWNVTMCGTQDALYRVITNYTDGLLSRICIARTPDNTYSALDDNPAQLTAEQEASIRQVAHLLPYFQGTINLPKLEERGRKWLEIIRMESIKNDDRVLARERMRGCVNAQRVTCALSLPRVVGSLIERYEFQGAEEQLKKNPLIWQDLLLEMQDEEMMQLFDLIADYLVDNDLLYFRERIEQAYESRDFKGNSGNIRAHRGSNDSIFTRLADEFTFDQAMQHSIAVKGTQSTKNKVYQMLKNWKNQGLVRMNEKGNYVKINRV